MGIGDHKVARKQPPGGKKKATAAIAVAISATIFGIGIIGAQIVCRVVEQKVGFVRNVRGQFERKFACLLVPMPMLIVRSSGTIRIGVAPTPGSLQDEQSFVFVVAVDVASVAANPYLVSVLVDVGKRPAQDGPAGSISGRRC